MYPPHHSLDTFRLLTDLLMPIQVSPQYPLVHYQFEYHRLNEVNYAALYCKLRYHPNHRHLYTHEMYLSCHDSYLVWHP